MDFEIRAARPDDAEALRALIATMNYQVEIQELGTRLETLPATDVVYVAQAGTEALGWTHVSITHSLIAGPRAELLGLSIADRAQGRGVGSALLSAAETWAAARGVPVMHLRSGAERTEAHAFYVARGYTVLKSQLALSKLIEVGQEHPQTPDQGGPVGG